MKKIITAVITACMCVMLLPMFFMTSASAGGSNVYLVSSSSVGNGQINTGDFLISGGVHAEGDSIVFDEQVSENAYIKTRSRINNMSDYGITRLFSAEFTLVVNDIAEGGSISFAFGLDSISNNAGAADSMELAVTYDGYLNFSVLKYTEAEAPEVVKSARFGNLNYLDEVSIKIEADYRNRLTVYIHDLETPFIYQKATDTDLSGYMAFSQTEQNDFAISAATVIGYRYETAENPDYVETFDNGEYNSNMFYSRALTSSFEGSSLSVKDGELVFHNAGDSYISTKYQYSNFELAFDLTDLAREPVYDNGVLAVPITNLIGLGFGCDDIRQTADATIHYSNWLHFEANSLGSNSTNPFDADNIGSTWRARYVLYEQGIGNGAKSIQSMIGDDKLMLWDSEAIGDKTVNVRFTVVDGVVSLYLKLEDEADFGTPVFTYDMGTTKTGYVRIFTYGTVGASDLTKADSGTFSIDNLSIRNLDYAPIRDSIEAPEFKSNLFDPAEDFEYTDNTDSGDLLANKIQSGNSAPADGAASDEGCNSSLSFSAMPIAIVAAVAVILIRKKIRGTTK